MLCLKREVDINFTPLLKDGACHYISIAMPGLTVACANIEFAGGFSVGHRNDFLMTVNRAQETGTLYPRVNITLLPSPSASYGGMHSDIYNDGDYSREEVILHILDAFKANSEYIKSDKMYFDFRNVGVSEKLYVSCLKAACDRYPIGASSEVITWEPKGIYTNE